MSNFDTASKVLNNLDVKVDKLDGFLYVNSQGEIEVRDINTKPNIISIWEGCDKETSSIDITDLVEAGDTNIKLLINGLYVNGNYSYSEPESINYGSSCGRIGVPSFFKVKLSSRFSLEDISDFFAEDNYARANIDANSSQYYPQLHNIADAIVANETLCELISINIPSNIIDDNKSFYIDKEKFSMRNKDVILTGKEIIKERKLYYRIEGQPEIVYNNPIFSNHEMIYYLNTKIDIISGRFYLKIGITNFTDEMMNYFNKNTYIQSDIIHDQPVSAKLISVSLLKDTKI